MEKKNIQNELKRLAITKRLNFLIGSGASFPAIKLMGMIEGKDEKEKNNNLKTEVIQVSSCLIEGNGEDDNINETLFTYVQFITGLIDILNLSNSRQTPKNINIFTTNYDLFLEKACDIVLKDYRFVLNDGSSGYFNRLLDSSNYNKTVAYRGLNDNYTNEIPSLTIIKPHGSVNWEKIHDKIYVRNNIVSDPSVVEPTGFESRDTFMSNHFHEMLRMFQLELDKQQSVLFVIGFSFQDKHIAKMIRRSLMNPELLIICFAFDEDDKNKIMSNLDFQEDRSNFKIFVPRDFEEKYVIRTKKGMQVFQKFTLTSLVKILAIKDIGSDDCE